MPDLRYLPNGNLEMVSNNLHEREWIKELLKKSTSEMAAESFFVVEAENLCGVFEQVAPEDVGALTEGLLISNGTDIYWDESYQILSFLEELSEGRPVIFQKG